MILSLPDFQIIRLVTSDAEELVLCLLEPLTQEEIDALKGHARQEIVELVRATMKRPEWRKG
jgi:hypothetical protein